MKNRIKIFVDGKSFTLVGEETEAHMQAVATYIHEKIGEIRGSAAATRMDTSLAYVLAALNVADDYFKEKERAAELEGRNLGLRTRLEGLMNQMDTLTKEVKELQERLTQTEEKSLEKDEIPVEVWETEYPKEIVLVSPSEKAAEESALPINQEEDSLKETRQTTLPKNFDVTQEADGEQYPKEIVLADLNEEVAEEIAAPITHEGNLTGEKQQVITKEVFGGSKNTAVQRPSQRKSKRGRSRKR